MNTVKILPGVSNGRYRSQNCSYFAVCCDKIRKPTRARDASVKKVRHLVLSSNSSTVKCPVQSVFKNEYRALFLHLIRNI